MVSILPASFLQGIAGDILTVLQFLEPPAALTGYKDCAGSFPGWQISEPLRDKVPA